MFRSENVSRTDSTIGGNDPLSKADLASILSDKQSKELDQSQANKNRSADPTKPTSVTLVTDANASDDMLDQFMGKLTQSKHFKDQVQHRQVVQDQLNRDVEKLFQKEAQVKTTDSVVLSTAMTAYGKAGNKKSTDTPNQFGNGDPSSHSVLPKDTALDRVQKQLAENGSLRQSDTLSTPTATRQAPRPDASDQNQRVHDALKQYVSALADELMQQTPGKKREVSEIKERLMGLGLSTRQLKGVEDRVTAFVQKDFRSQIKNGFTQFALTYTKKFSPELFEASKQYKALESMGLDSGVFTGPSDIQSFKSDAKRELTSFVADELDQTMIREKLNNGSPRALVAEFNKFNELASVIHFDAASYMKELSKKINNLGLSHFVPPDGGNRGAMDTDSGGGQRRHQQQAESAQMESTLLSDGLRSLVIQKWVRSDILGTIEASYKIARMRNKLKKSGISESELSEIEKEGAALAKLRLSDLVRESLEERAALSVLDGPAYDLIRSKLKRALKGLKRLDSPIPKEAFKMMRDQINRGMFTVVKEEFLKVDAMAEAATSLTQSLAAKHKNLLAHLHRLRAESGIIEEIKSTGSQVLQRGPSSVTEAA